MNAVLWLAQVAPVPTSGTDPWVWIVLAVLALGGPLLGYLAKVRQASGRVRDSDASALWAEGAAIRKECAERVKELEQQLRWEREQTVMLIQENARLQRIAAGDGHA